MAEIYRWIENDEMAAFLQSRQDKRLRRMRVPLYHAAHWPVKHTATAAAQTVTAAAQTVTAAGHYATAVAQTAT